jgi:hypothetical protein
MTEPARRGEHANHDLFLLASAADRDVDPITRSAADLQIAGCPDCARIHADLLAISAGIRDLPTALPVPRDFRLSEDKALRLRRASGWRRLLQPFGPAGIPSLRPLATAFTTLGLAGLIFSAVVPGALGGGPAAGTGGSAPQSVEAPGVETDRTGSQTGPKAGETGNPTDLGVRPVAGGQSSPGTNFGSQAGGPVSSPVGRELQESDAGEDTAALPVITGSPASLSPWLAVTALSLVLLAVGVIMLGLRLAARRLE